MLKADSSRSRISQVFNERQSTKSGLSKEKPEGTEIMPISLVCKKNNYFYKVCAIFLGTKN
jgi:hypothetical protein